MKIRKKNVEIGEVFDENATLPSISHQKQQE